MSSSTATRALCEAKLLVASKAAPVAKPKSGGQKSAWRVEMLRNPPLGLSTLVLRDPAIQDMIRGGYLTEFGIQLPYATEIVKALATGTVTPRVLRLEEWHFRRPT